MTLMIICRTYVGDAMKKGLLISLTLLIIFPLASASSVDNVEFEEVPSAWEVGEDLEFNMEASGNNLDNVRFQSRESGGAFFSTQDTIYCQTRDTCDGIVSHTEHSEGTWEYRFRGFAGDDRENSRVQEVKYVRDLDYSVSWSERPPSEAERDESIQMTVRALDDGERLSSEGLLQLQYWDGSEWTTFDTRDCSTSSSVDSCSNTGSITLEGDVVHDGEAEFRGFIEFRGGVTAESSSEFTSIIETERVDDVELDSLPDSHEIDTELEITGEASGRNLDEIKLQKRVEGGDWERVTDTGCSGSQCTFEHEYEHGEPEEVDFRLRAEAGDDFDFSDVETVEFFEKAEIDNVILEDLPSEWSVDESLELEASAEGTRLEELAIQRSERGEDDWTEIESTSCNEDCSLETDYTASEEEDKDFRAKAFAEDDLEEASDIQEVDFKDDSDSIDSVTINDLPSEVEVEEEVDIEGDASGNNLESIEIQFREEDDWDVLEEESCDSTSCEVEGSYSSDEEREVEFRIKAFTEDLEDESGIETVNFFDPVDEIDSVTLDNLPSNHPLETELEISGQASGDELTRIVLQEREPGDSWSQVSSRDCNRQSTCSIDETYEAFSEKDVEFRIKAETDDGERFSSSQTVSFRKERRVDSVSLDTLPSNHPVGESLELEGEASGSNLEEIKILTRRVDRIGWQTVEEKTCSGSSCEISGSFTASEAEGREFVVRARSGGDERLSATRFVDFREVQEPEVDSVFLSNLPAEHDVDDPLTVSADASGTELDSLEIQYRENGDWNTLDSTSCAGSSCSFDTDFEADTEGEVDFRAKADAGDDTKFSDTQTVLFTEAPEPGVTDVTIEELPDTHPVDTELQIDGEASGTELDSLEVQERKDDDWETVEQDSCAGSTCIIQISVMEDEETTVDYRVKAEAGDEEGFSDVETVQYLEPEEDPRVDSVTLESLPDTYEVDKELDLEAEASGNELEELRILSREVSKIAWNEVDSTDCSGSSCALDATYTSEKEETREFVAEASAGDDEAQSVTRVVTFQKEDDDDDKDDDAEDAELDIKVMDRDENSIRNARVEASNGENKVKYTDSSGETSFNLKADTYDVEASREGYESETQRVTLDEGDEDSLEFRLRQDGFPVNIVSVDAPETICEGDGFTVDAAASNLRSTGQTVAVHVGGDASSPAKIIDIEASGVKEFSLDVERVEGLGEKEFFVKAENDGSNQRDFTVEVEDCDREVEAPERTPSGITINARPSVLTGETVRVRGEVAGTREPREVTVKADGRELETVTSSRRGQYQAFISFNEPGRKSVQVSTDGGRTARQSVNVNPRASVNPIQAPHTVVQGQEFDVCAEVESEVEPRVVLERDGKVQASRDASGEVCFTQRASSPGQHRYLIRAVTSGAGSSASKTVNVIADDNEVESFPDSVTTVKTESGLSRVSLYNRGTEVSRYDIEISGVNTREVSQTSKTEVLAPGQRETVYFYFSPTESSQASIQISRDGEVLETRNVDIRAVESPQRRGGIRAWLGL